MIAGKYGIGKNENGEAGVPMYRVIPACSNETWADEFVTTCPIAGLREHWIHEAMDLHHTIKTFPGFDIKALVGTPSNHCLEAINAVSSAMAGIEANYYREKSK